MKSVYTKPEMKIKQYNVRTTLMSVSQDTDAQVYDAGGKDGVQYTLGTLNQ